MLEPGTTLQRGYVIEKVLGRGGMGAVYLARQASLGGRRVAIKEIVIPTQSPEERDQAVAQFQKEAEILASLEHPGLVDVKDYFEENGSQYLVMAFIDGSTLEEVCRPAPADPPPVAQVVDWMLAVCDVLAYLHEHEPPVIVRDLKPSNVMLDANGRIRVIDFGIARVFDDVSHTSTFLKGAGTVGFAPIEQHGGGTTDPRSDVYGLGATTYRLLTGMIAPGAVALVTGEATLTPPSVLNPRVTPPLEAVVLRMMSARKEDRYPTSRAAAEELRKARESLAPTGRPPVGVAPRFCHNCGTTLVPGTPHCAKCGQALDPAVLGGETAAWQGPPSGRPSGPAPAAGSAPAPPSWQAGAASGPAPGPPGWGSGPASGPPGAGPGPASGPAGWGSAPASGPPGAGPGPASGPAGWGSAPASGPPGAGPGAVGWGSVPAAPGASAWAAGGAPPATAGPSGWSPGGAAAGSPGPSAWAPGTPGSSSWGPGSPPSPSGPPSSTPPGSGWAPAPPWSPNPPVSTPPSGSGKTFGILAVIVVLAALGWWLLGRGTPTPQPTSSPSTVASATPTPTSTPSTTPTPTPAPSTPENGGWQEVKGVTGRWVGTVAGNDPNVRAVFDLRQSGTLVTGTFTWNSPLTGTCVRRLSGSYDSEDESYVLHDDEIVSQNPTRGRFCKVDEYELSLEGNRLSGTYTSDECEDEGTINLRRE
jgi:serine/threonine-protein kinase